MSVALVESARTERDPLTGRFLDGNRASVGAGGNSGRMREFRQAVLAALSPEELAALVRRLYRDAMAGDDVAAALLLDRTLGKPLPGVHESGTDGGPLVVFEPLVLRGIDPERVRTGDHVNELGLLQSGSPPDPSAHLVNAENHRVP